MPVAQYHIHNTTKDIRTRTARVLAPGNPKTVLFLSGGSIRVMRQRPFPCTEALIRRLAPELLQNEKLGRCKVTSHKGERVDLTRFVSAEPVKKAAPPADPVPPAPEEPPAPPAPAPVVEEPAPEPAAEEPAAQEPEAPVEETPVEEPVAELPVEEPAEEPAPEQKEGEPAEEQAAATTTEESADTSGGSSRRKKKRR